MKTLSITAAALISIAGIATAQDATRALTNVIGDVYRWQNNNHFGLVVFTKTVWLSVTPSMQKPPLG